LYLLSLPEAMRSFIVVGHKATTSPNFSLEDIPGTSGRLDILCRCINAAFVLSHGIRKDVNVFLVLLGGDSAKTLWLRGDCLKHLNPDERTTAALLKKALALEAADGWRESTPGIFVRTGSLAAALHDLNGASLFYLRENGEDVFDIAADIDNESISDDAVFILGDHVGMTEEEERMIAQAGSKVISVGPMSLHADHCIVLINSWLDRINA
jgi:tRNA (pseudouridine54-N1)-methyltransferase